MARRLDADEGDGAGGALSVMRALGLLVALLASVGLAWHVGRPDAPPDRGFCTADGYITDDGRTLHRGNDQDCRWVDENGNLVAVDENGQPTG